MLGISSVQFRISSKNVERKREYYAEICDFSTREEDAGYQFSSGPWRGWAGGKVASKARFALSGEKIIYFSTRILRCFQSENVFFYKRKPDRETSMNCFPKVVFRPVFRYAFLMFFFE